ncbi:hypothetical protein TWF706_004890 [Orbilia oligospora]|nr:hypothetical protein TWF706_004890 [Orbilia oligospora]
MAQGTKKLTKPTTTKSRPQTLGPRKGNRVIAPKNQILIKQNAIKKVRRHPYILLSSKSRRIFNGWRKENLC